MAVKKATAKAKARRTTPKGKAKAKAPKKPARAKAKAKAKAKPTAKAAPTRKRRARAATAPTAPREEPSVEAPRAADTTSAETKKGALARLASGVGNLFARVTGMKGSESAAAPAEASIRTPEQTIELSSDDILAATAAPPALPKPKR